MGAPSLPFCIVTFDRSELLAYAQRFVDAYRRSPSTSSCVARFVPVLNLVNPAPENALFVRKEEINLNHAPLAELIGKDGQLAGFLIPVVTKVDHVPNAVLLPEISNASNCIYYSVNIPLQAQSFMS